MLHFERKWNELFEVGCDVVERDDMWRDVIAMDLLQSKEGQMQHRRNEMERWTNSLDRKYFTPRHTTKYSNITKKKTFWLMIKLNG